MLTGVPNKSPHQSPQVAWCTGTSHFKLFLTLGALITCYQSSVWLSVEEGRLFRPTAHGKLGMVVPTLPMMCYSHWPPWNLPASFKLSTLLGECDRRFREVVLEVDLGSGHAQHPSVLLTDTLTNFNHRLDFFKKAVCFLAGRFNSGSDFVSINGIIGLDLICYMFAGLGLFRPGWTSHIWWGGHLLPADRFFSLWRIPALFQ